LYCLGFYQILRAWPLLSESLFPLSSHRALSYLCPSQAQNGCSLHAYYQEPEL
jgi:hypothetical protein